MKTLNNMDEMIEFGGSYYIIDLDKFNALIIQDTEKGDKHVETETKTTYVTNAGASPSDPMDVQSTVVTSREFDKGQEINAPKYDVVRMCLEILFTYNEAIDDTLGQDRAFKDTTIPFKIAFNTLINYGILKEIEE